LKIPACCKQGLLRVHSLFPHLLKYLPAMNHFLAKLLHAERLTEIVDIGANPIDGHPPYQQMLKQGLCRVTGFEPQAKALHYLQSHQSTHERYLPYAIADGQAHTLNVYRASGMTSLLEVDPTSLDVFNRLKPFCKLKHRIPLQTKTLDDIQELHHLDFLKMDIQGSELSVLQYGTQRLTQTVAIQCEVSFIPLYKHQPTMGELDIELRKQGFIPHCFTNIKQWPIPPYKVDNDPRKPLHQIIEADMVYVRNFLDASELTHEQLKHLALIMHYCYQSYDLTLRCVGLLEQRQILKKGSSQTYQQTLEHALNGPLLPSPNFSD
jgi:FkbM family methyltransferase